MNIHKPTGDWAQGFKWVSLLLILVTIVRCPSGHCALQRVSAGCTVRYGYGTLLISSAPLFILRGIIPMPVAASASSCSYTSLPLISSVETGTWAQCPPSPARALPLPALLSVAGAGFWPASPYPAPTAVRCPAPVAAPLPVRRPRPLPRSAASWAGSHGPPSRPGRPPQSPTARLRA